MRPGAIPAIRAAGLIVAYSLASFSISVAGTPVKDNQALTLAEAAPEDITIDAVKAEVDLYEPVDFYHFSHVYRFTDIVNEGSLAKTFHTDPLIVCASCHHYSTVATKKAVAPCGTCHINVQEPRAQMPTLYGAYHQQCLGCHKKMNAEPMTCDGCHPKKEDAIEGDTT